MNSSLKERFARLGPVRAVDRAPSGSHRVVILRLNQHLHDVRIIDATLALAKRGATMLRAKRALEAVLAGRLSLVILPTVEDDDALQGDLKRAGISMRQVPETRLVNLPALRKRLHMTREQFALAYGLDQETVRNWEAGRRDPGPARAYLQAIENDPEGVIEAYSGVSLGR